MSHRRLYDQGPPQIHFLYYLSITRNAFTKGIECHFLPCNCVHSVIIFLNKLQFNLTCYIARGTLNRFLLFTCVLMRENIELDLPIQFSACLTVKLNEYSNYERSSLTYNLPLFLTLII